MMNNYPTVYLVGAGPSGRDLLTLRAADLLSRAEVIVYDALVDRSIHRLFAQDAELIYVGKRAGKHALSQPEINALLLEVARRCTGVVVRLKGGDPFVFGRGGEEMMALHQAGIPYQIVPGVTSGIAAPAYAGIPVTHRGVSRSLIFVTAFTQDTNLPPIDWEALAHLDGTIVFYMGMRVVPEIARQLMSVGMTPDKPVAIISQGTRPSQKTILTHLGALTPEAYDYEALTPALLLVGDVADFANHYGWYTDRPLSGKRILVTRSEGQSSALETLLSDAGAEAVVLPSIEIVPMPMTVELEELFTRDDRPDWWVFTSPNGVSHFCALLEQRGLDARFFASSKLAAIGPATAEALRAVGLRADLIPTEHTATGMARAIAEIADGREISVVNPTSRITTGDLSAALSGYPHISCQQIAVYDNRSITYSQQEIEALFSERFDWITFCSSSAVRNFMMLIREHRLESLVKGTRLAAIGRMTRTTLETEFGLSVSACPPSPQLPLLVEAMAVASTNDA